MTFSSGNPKLVALNAAGIRSASATERTKAAEVLCVGRGVDERLALETPSRSLGFFGGLPNLIDSYLGFIDVGR